MQTPMHTSFRPLIELRRLALLALLTGVALAAPSLPAASPAATWSTGHKKVLIIPIRFTDQAGPSDTPGPNGYLSGWSSVTNGTATAELSAFFARQSYGKTTLEFTVLPEINMGVSYTTYNAMYGNSGLTKFTQWGEPGSLADDARAKARLAGQAIGQAALYDTDNYDLDIILSGFIPGQGTLSSGRSFGKGIFGNTAKALAHELCHNFGLQHANGISRASYYAPVKSGTFFTDAYGDVYDLMGWKNTTPIPLPQDRDANPYWKNLMGWLPDGSIINPMGSGTYRIFAFDQPVLEAGKNYALRIVRDSNRTYWFSYRQSITNAESIWSSNGLEVRIGGESVMASSGHTTMLDMTPGSRGLANVTGVSNTAYATMYDAQLALGRTYTDAEANLHITPVMKGGTVPESLDVVVNYGPFPGNVAPVVSISPASVSVAAGVAQTFTATATDADGDTLAYYWEFDDADALGGNAAGNTNPDARLSTQGSHTWTRNGTYLVRCTVTDMKGHTTIGSASVTVTGGTTARLIISGLVKDENGNPLAGAVVNNFKPGVVNYGASNFAGSSETAADGKFAVQVPPIGTSTYNLNVLYKGFAFTCSVANGAVTVSSASITNVNFTRVRTNHTISGGIYVAGRGYDPATDGSLTVTAGAQNVSASPGFWSAVVPDGVPLNVTATPGNPAYGVNYFAPSPYVAVDDFNLMHLFVNIPGQMPQVGFGSSGMTSDDTAGMVNIPVTLTLPAGSNSWPANQAIYYWIDQSSSAEYGVDYKMTGGPMTFTGGQVPTPQMIPLKVIHDGVPKSKTIVLKVGPASSIANVGPITTFTYTITNPPPPISSGVIQFAQSTYSVAESAGTVTLVATRTGGSTGSASAYYRTADGTALAGQDYAPATNAVSWADGDAANKNIVITILNDAVVEPNETFTVAFFTNSAGSTLGAMSTATVTITDDDTPPPSPGVIQFAQSNYSVGETAGTVTLVATRTGGSDGSVNGYYRTANGTATAGQDYTGTTNLVTWANGDSAPKNVVISILNDAVVEPTETFTVTFFTTFGGATLGAQATTTVTITDDDTPPPSPGVIQFAQSNYSVGESAGTVTLVATRTDGSSGSVNGYCRTANGTAIAGQDYTATTNVVTWPDGDTAPKNVVITILNDLFAEPTESFTVSFFTTFGGATLGAQATATVTITDDDTPPPSPGVIQFAQSNYSVGEAAGTVTLVATRTDGSSGSVNGYYRTANGTAVAGQDYAATTNVVTWADGDTAPKNVVITIVNDVFAEPTESFTVSFFTTFGGASLGAQATATVTITDDDTPPPSAGVIQFAQSNYSVGEAAGTVTLVATRTDGANGTVSGYYRTANGTAIAGLDYAAATNSVSWADGDATPKNVVITILNDSAVEPAETFTVTFFTTSGGVTLGAQATATVTITDDDTPPPGPGVIQFAQSNYFVGEAAGTVTLVATRTGGSTSNVTAYYRTTDGTATAGQDYTATTNAVNWGSFDTAPKNIVIPILNDSAVEPDETFTVTFFTTTGGATLGVPATVTVTITDDDTAVPSPGVIQLAQSIYSAGESAGTVTLVATRTDGANGTVSAYYRTADGTATAGQDYIAATNSLTWADGDTAPKDIVITILNDSVPETNESFYVSLFAPAGGATLGRASAVVNILDDDIPPTTENHPPVLPGASVITIQKLTELVYTNTAIDIDVPAQALTYQLLVGPSGATIDANGIVRWTPPTAGTNYFQMKVTDNGSPARSATNSFYVIVNEPVAGPENHAPVLPANTVVTLVRPATLVLANTATDIDVPAQTLTYQLLASPGGATIDANGIVRWTPTAASTNFFQAKVTDSGTPARSATNSFYVIVKEPAGPENHPPVLPMPTVVTILRTNVLVFTNTATDIDVPAQTLTYQLLAGPSGASIDANGIVRWTPSSAGPNFFQTKVTDNGSPARSATNSFYVVVNEPAAPENHPPVLPPPGVVSILKLAPLVYVNTATDADQPPQTLTYQLLVSPSGATIDANGIVRWTPATAGTNYFQAKVTDNGSPARSATNSFYVIVNEPVSSENHTPVLPRPTVVTALKLTETVITNTATDIDLPAQLLTYELLTKPDGATIDSDGIVRWTPSATQGSSTNRFRTKVTDNGTPPRSATNVFYVIVNEGNTAPVLFGRSLLMLTNPASLSEIYTATDSDTPVNTLTFNLVSGPAWVSFTQIGEHSAALTGTPPVVTAETPMVAVVQVTDNGTPPLSNQLRVYLLLRPAPPTTSTESFVTRDLPSGYVPGTRLTVTLQASPASGSAYAVNDTPPGGWALGAISHGGQLDPATGQVQFGPFADAAARTLTYELTPPISETGPKNFVGIASKDNVISGIGGEGILNQAQAHPADLNADLQLNTPELAAYASAWQDGSAWPTGPNPIEVSFVTRAGFLVQRGGAYSVNASAKLPLAWIPAGQPSAMPRITTATGFVPTGKGCWRFLPPKLAVGAPATVTVILNPGTSDACHAVEEIPPAGWTVTNISHAGVYDAASGRVRWGLFTDQTSRTLSYDVTPTGALAPFAGVASFDGTNAPIAGAFEPMIVPAIAEPEFAPVTRLPSGEMVLPLSTRFGSITVIEISDDLRLWTPVWTNSPGSQLFRDLPLNLPPGRYYRSVEQ